MSDIVQLVNFEECHAINELFVRIGISAKLGEFSAGHLTQVFRQQHADVEIRSITFVESGDGSADGYQSSECTIMQVEVINIPINVVVVLANNGQLHELNLNLKIKASFKNGKFDVNTDLYVGHQTVL